MHWAKPVNGVIVCRGKCCGDRDQRDTSPSLSFELPLRVPLHCCHSSTFSTDNLLFLPDGSGFLACANSELTFSENSVLQGVDRAPWMGDQPIAKPQPTQDITDVHTPSGIRIHDPSVWDGGVISSLTSCRHCRCYPPKRILILYETLMSTNSTCLIFFSIFAILDPQLSTEVTLCVWD
jgi:hypothetical protein